MSGHIIRYLLLFLVMADCIDEWLVPSVAQSAAADVPGNEQSFAPIAIRYRAEIQKEIERPHEVSLHLPAGAFLLSGPDLLCQSQPLVLPPLAGADPLYAFMSLQR